MVVTRRQAAQQNANGSANGKNAFNGTHDKSDISNETKQNGESKTWAETNGTGNRNAVWGLSGTAGKLVALIGAVLLMVLCPGFAIYTWFILTKCDGSVLTFAHHIAEGGLPALRAAWPSPSRRAWSYVAGFGALQAALQVLVPGKVHRGPITPKGNVPHYRANGVQRWAVTLLLFFAAWRRGWFEPADVYDAFGEILSALNIFSLLFCVFLYVKGHLFPSSTDAGSTGSLVYDYYWGMELYPRIGKSFDLKTWTNCGMGMMGWAVLPLCYAAWQQRHYGSISSSMWVSLLLIEAYVFKFFLWETGYWGSMDIAHDRAGYYICWGCLVWVPAIYTSPPLYLASHPLHLPLPLAAAFLLAGLACIYVNYDADRQRQEFRASNGKALVWGRAALLVKAEYVTAGGKSRSSLLLASGWWGVARHFHYVPEILAAFFWTVPALFHHVLPYFYVIFLTLLLTDRAYRDDLRCRAKYGKYWDQYCELVPYKMLPFVF